MPHNDAVIFDIVKSIRPDERSQMSAQVPIISMQDTSTLTLQKPSKGPDMTNNKYIHSTTNKTFTLYIKMFFKLPF